MANERPLLLMVGHGSRGDDANAEFEQLVDLYQQRRPEFEIHHSYIEIAHPLLPEALANLGHSAGDVTLLPLFLFAAGHVKRDIPAALEIAQQKSPDLRFRTARELGIHPALVSLALQRAESVMSPANEMTKNKPTVILVGRGSSDPEANDEFQQVAHRLMETSKFQDVLPCFVGIAQPRFERALEVALNAAADQLLVLPYFLFRGRLLTKIHEQAASFQAQNPTIKFAIAPHLGVTEQLLTVMDERLDEVYQIRPDLPHKVDSK